MENQENKKKLDELQNAEGMKPLTEEEEKHVVGGVSGGGASLACYALYQEGAENKHSSLHSEWVSKDCSRFVVDGNWGGA